MESEPTMSQSGPRNFYCHQCNSRTRISIEEFTCSSCGSGFIEEIVENDADESREGGAGGNADEPWAHDTEFEGEHEAPAILQFLSSMRRPHGTRVGRSRGPGGTRVFGNSGGPGDQFLQSLLSNLTGMHGPGQFQFMMGGPPGSNVMYGNPGDYAWGSGGFDAIVTQLLNQMEGAGPPRMEKDDISGLPTLNVTQEHIDHKAQCSVCWEDFVLDESVNQLRCEHIFHKDCITPWLELHATCPVCRKPQNDAATAHSRQAQQNEASSERDSNVNIGSSQFPGNSSVNDDNDSPMFEWQSPDSTPATSTNTSQMPPTSTTSDTGENRSTRRSFSIVFSQNFSPSNSSSRRTRSQSRMNPLMDGFSNPFSALFEFTPPTNVNPSQSNPSSQALPSSSGSNEDDNVCQSSIPPLVDVSSSSTETIGNSNRENQSATRSAMPNADSSTDSSTHNSADLQDFDVE